MTSTSASAPASRAFSARPREIATLCLFSFLIMCSYEIARPAVESLFLARYGQAGLPWVWLTVALAAFGVVAVYNRLAARVSVLALFVGASFSSVVLFVIGLVLQVAQVHWAPFALYVVKDLYPVILVEAFWSMANLHFSTTTARSTYGIICAAGSLGAVTGGFAVGALAALVGSTHSLWLTAGLVTAVGLGAATLGRGMHQVPPPLTGQPSLREAARTLTRSSYLGLMVLLIACTQLVITLIDYEFNGSVAAAYPDTDLRTRTIGAVYAVIAGVAFLLQLSTSIVIRKIGVGRTLVTLPLVLILCITAFIVAPVFGVMAVAKVASKAFDYSWFRAAKELLYIPLSYREKTEGKAVVDMLTYRVAKGGVSLLLLGVSVLGLTLSVPWLTIAILTAWIGIALAISRRYVARVGAGGKS